MDDCLFCKIANKSVSAKIVYEDKNSVGFLDIFPLSEGHTVVIPKKHAETIIELNNNSVSEFFKSVKNAVNLVKEKINPDGFTIGINHGKVSGQAIDHLHVHIIPRFKDDGGGSLHSVMGSHKKINIEEVYKKFLSLRDISSRETNKNSQKIK